MFSFQTFLIILRETLESAIVISVLLSFIHQNFSTFDATTYKRLQIQVWAGGLLGLIVCLIIGTGILTVFYLVGNDLWSVTEHYWEGTFSILASVIISVMGIKILRVNRMQDKWRTKLSHIINSSGALNKSAESGLFSDKYAMFILPFVTTLREGMEAIVFMGGIGINEDTSVWSILNAAVSALVLGTAIGVILYRSGNTLSLQWFLIISTGFLYLVAAGLFSKGVWNFELQHFIDLCDGFDVSETGHGPGSYDISRSVWHVNCCNGELQDDGAFWMIFTAVLGWTNSATYGSVSSYILYWVVIIAVFTSLLHEEKHGYLPVIPISWQKRRIEKRALYVSVPRDEARLSIDTVDSHTKLIRV